MKKFLTVLLVIAVMFTFSFSSAFATTTYNYAQAVQKIEDSAQALKDVAKAAYDTAVAGATKTVAYATTASTYVSADAQIAVFKKEYNDYVKTVDARCKAATNAFDDAVAVMTGGRDAYEAAEASFASYYVNDSAYDASSNPYGAGTLTLSTVPGHGSANDITFVLFAKEEFKLVKAATLKGLAEIDLTVYSTKKATASTPSDFEKASAIVDEAIALVNGYDYVSTTTNVDLAAMVDNMKALYVAPEGVTPYGGLIKTNNDTGTGTPLTALSGASAVIPKGLGSLTALDKEATATVKLAYAKSSTLTKVTGELNVAKMEALKGVNSLILAETKKGDKADAKKLAEYSDMQANIEAAYNDALEVIKYLIDNAETVAELGEYKDLTGTAYDGFYSGWKVTPGTLSGTNYVGLFNDASLGFTHTGYDPDGTVGTIVAFNVTATPDVAAGVVAGVAEVYNAGATVSELSGIVTNANRAKAEAARLKEQILIDGTEYANIDKALEDSLDAIYRGKGTKLTGVTTTHPVDALYHYVNGQLIATAGKFVTINGTKYPTTANWDATPGLYDAVKYKEVEKITDDTEKALKAAKTKEEADAAFLAGYEKFDAVITKAEHKADFLYSTGKNHEKYLAVKAELEAYINAKQAYLDKLDVADDYPALTGGTLLNDYNSANGIFYTKCFTAEELDAALAKAKAVVDGLKTEKALKEEGAAILKEIPALTKATVADKDVVMAVYDKYAAHNDYCATVGSAESINSYKIERLALDVEAAEAKAIEEAIAAIAKDGKVTVDEKAAIEALRKAYDAYMDYWVYSEDYIGTGLLLGSQSLNADKYSVTGVLVSTGTNTDCDVDDFEAALDVAEANEVINMIGKLPATGATAEQVKAATAAFEALSRDAKELVFHEPQYDKLVDLQKLVAGNVKELKIVASSKATKGAITVKWTVKEGDVTAADGFQVWKSTKMNSGYKKAFTTTKTSYKNTKGLKKGTKYYYKVRAYKVVDGKNVYSDWSNKAYRTAK